MIEDPRQNGEPVKMVLSGLGDIDRSQPNPSDCDLCDRGFELRGGLHIGSQSKGMIPLSICRRVGLVIAGCPECAAYVDDDWLARHIETNLSNYDYHFPEFVTWKCRNCGHRFAIKVEGELEAIPHAIVRRVLEVKPDEFY